MSRIALQTSDVGSDCYTLYMHKNFLTRDNALHYASGPHEPFGFCPKMHSARHIDQPIQHREDPMSAEILIGDGEAARLVQHPLRAAILGEVHARPFTPIPVPSRVLHFAFDTSGARAQVDRANLVAFCESRGVASPSPTEKHHRAPFGTTVLRWEQHSEFTTYTW
jgi:Protein of unknown function (DUF3422)